MLKYKFLFLSLLLTSILSAGITYAWLVQKLKTSLPQSDEALSQSACKLSIRRGDGYSFIHPILFVESPCESPQLLAHKGMLEKVIESEKSSGQILSASVYLREFDNANWLSVNSDEKYNPGSVLKIPQLMAFYKMEEKNPGFMQRKIAYNRRLDDNRNVNFESRHIQPGQSYSIGELMRRMIQYSDNEATMLLSTQLDTLTMNEVFVSLGLRTPSYTSRYYPSTASEISLFLRSLYNASFLNYRHSEACLSLLSQTEFDEGLIKGLPPGTKVSHKFGESGYDNEPELSETAIVYAKEKTYLITVMTRGKNLKVQAQSIARITAAAHEVMTRSL